MRERAFVSAPHEDLLIVRIVPDESAEDGARLAAAEARSLVHRIRLEEIYEHKMQRSQRAAAALI